MDLFTYGTLQVPALMRRVSGARLPGQTAVLPGYACYRLGGTCYPGIRPQAGACTSGVLYRGLVARQLARLDRFEGDEYLRVQLPVQTCNGSRQLAWVYLLQPARRAGLSTEPWDRQVFERRHLGRWLRGAVRAS